MKRPGTTQFRQQRRGAQATRTAPEGRPPEDHKDKKKKKIKIILSDGSGIKIGTVGHKNTEGAKDAKKIKGKPHSSISGRVASSIRTSPLVVKFNKGGRTGLKHGGSVGAAIRGRGAEIK